MHQDKGLLKSGVPAGAHWRAISEAGRQYALYLHHSTGGKHGTYIATPGTYREALAFDLPAGTYHADWIDAAQGSVIRSERIRHAGGARTLSTPNYKVDVALRIKRVPEPVSTP